MSRKRKSLAEWQQETQGPHVPEPTPKAEPVRRQRAVSRPSAASSVRLGIGMAPATFEALKSAYVWITRHDPDAPQSLAQLVDAALNQHAVRSATGRRRTAQRLDEEAYADGEKNVVRTFAVELTTIDRLDEAITADEDAGRYLSRSSWANEAVRDLIARTRERAGGELPPAPARLTRRPARN